MRTLSMLLVFSVGLSAVAWAGDDAQPALTIEVEMVVLDAKGEPLIDLQREEVGILQDARSQAVAGFEKTGVPGHYTLRYAPRSGQPGAMSVRIFRKGTTVRGPNGDRLEPRVVRALTTLEATLVRILETGDGGDLPCASEVLRFDWGEGGRKHLFTAEIPFSSLRFESRRAHVQILARITGPQGPSRLLTLDRVVEVASPFAASVERLIWTNGLRLEPGRYTIEMLVHDANAGRRNARRFPLEVSGQPEGIAISSVTTLQPRGAFYEDTGADQELVYEGIALMPQLAPRCEQGANAHVRLFATLYPDATNTAPVTLRAELLKDGEKMADLPTALPQAQPNGEIRWAATMPTSRLPLGHWQFVLVAGQGASATSERVSFEIVEHLTPVVVPTRPASSDAAGQ